jgi:hypothetical protein
MARFCRGQRCQIVRLGRFLPARSLIFCRAFATPPNQGVRRMRFCDNQSGLDLLGGHHA